MFEQRTVKPELMSPAGHWPQLEAAVAAGADAVYFGLQHFSARAKVGFELCELPDVIRFLHRHAVKGFVTFNTLIFDHEIQQAGDTILAIAQSGCDAIIVQDIGIAKIARQIAPGLDIHGSTQMSITSAQGAELAGSLGCSRVVLGRELSVDDIRRIAKATDVELEVFVHGALCVSYSGQCFSSEAWGGRSANRGKCAQACRLSYDLIVDGQQRDLGEFRYLLSPGDLYALEQIPELIEIGIDCFKIEGRYKGPEYVTLTTRAYREAIDACFADSSHGDPTVSRNELEQIYSRGLGPHFISGVNHQAVVAGRVPRHRGLLVGQVVGVDDPAVTVNCRHEITPGDGIVFDSATWRSPNEPEEGGNVFEVETLGQSRCQLKFGYGDINFHRIRTGDLVYRTKSPSLIRKAVGLSKLAVRKTGLHFKVNATVGKSLEVAVISELGETASFRSQEKLDEAKSNPLDLITLQQQFARLGGTPFYLNAVQLIANDATDVLPGENQSGQSYFREQVFCPVSLLNRARREIVEQLVESRESLPKRQLVGSFEPSNCVTGERKKDGDSDLTQPTQLHVLVRNTNQLDAAIGLNPASITLDYLELYGLRPSIQRIQEKGILARVASPRILKPSEQNVVRFLLSLDCQILVRSGGLLHDLVHQFGKSESGLPELHGDFSLNAANKNSFNIFLEMGLNRITPTHDLNAKQISDLATSVNADALEVIVFHHLPVFHTEHCVFCRFLSEGTDHTNCGHPCEKHEVSLLDSSGRRHPVMADVGCRNTVFGAEAQVADRQLLSWQRAGLRHFRIEFVHETASEVESITNSFANFFNQKIDATALRHELEVSAKSGVTEGSLFVPRNFKQLVQLK